MTLDPNATYAFDLASKRIGTVETPAALSSASIAATSGFAAVAPEPDLSYTPYYGLVSPQWGRNWPIEQMRLGALLYLDANDDTAADGDAVVKYEFALRSQAERETFLNSVDPNYPVASEISQGALEHDLWQFDVTANDAATRLLPIGQRGVLGDLSFDVEVRGHVVADISSTANGGAEWGFLALVDHGETVQVHAGAFPPGGLDLPEYTQGTLRYDAGPREGTLFAVQTELNNLSGDPKVRVWVYMRGWAYDAEGGSIGGKATFADATSAPLDLVGADYVTFVADGVGSRTGAMTVRLRVAGNTATGDYEVYVRKTDNSEERIWPDQFSSGNVASVQAVIDSHLVPDLKTRGYMRTYGLKTPAVDLTDDTVPYIKFYP